ncbi:MAG: phenylalanyl-tRNA synthetase alpha chain, partial [Acidimicrobiaceae bacterium]
MIDDIQRIAADGAERAAAAATLDDLRAVDGEVLGKRSELSLLKQQLGALEPDARREAGRALNEARQQVEAAVAARRAA